MKFYPSFCLFLSVVLFSCQSVPKDITYFENLQGAGNEKPTTFGYIEYEPKIKISDALMITVSSPNTNQELIAQFNLPTVSYLSPGERTVLQSTTMQTYIVDRDGYVTYPIIGKIHLAGLTLAEATDTLTGKVAEYVYDPIIIMNILSFKVSVLGEVQTPGPVVVTNSRISVLDAIGAAGDLTIFGNRKNVRLIRDNNGRPEVAYLDLTSSEIFSSPYFYLQQNDVIVVDPNNTRKRDSKYGEAEAYKLSLFSTILSSVSVISGLITTIIALNRK